MDPACDTGPSMMKLEAGILHGNTIGREYYFAWEHYKPTWDFPGGASGKESRLPRQERQDMQVQSLTWAGRFPGVGSGNYSSILYSSILGLGLGLGLGKFHGQRSLEGNSPWGHKGQT